MITDKDIIKLKAVFATKEDLQQFATKEDITDLRLGVGEIKDELGEVKEDVRNVKRDVEEIKNTLHGFAGSLNDLWMENGAAGVAIGRHNRQIEALAQHTGAKLPE